MEEVEAQEERAVLFGPIYPGSVFKDEQVLDELGRLVESAGGLPVGRVVQSIRSPHAATFFGSGKIETLRQTILETGADIAVFDEELTPAQARNIERIIKTRVVDRSELILDIFANRARSTQAKLQVELAQLQYKLPRLKRMWTHLDRIKSAIGARGPGETQIETDRRLIRLKIQQYTQKLKHLTEVQHRTIRNRSDFKVSLVGYTNAGKSTLMRALTGSDVYVADQLFATLDTTTRKLKINDIGTCLLSDTVGFVSKLPHHLVSSFHATLSEAMEADLLLHVLDASDPQIGEHFNTVQHVLEQIQCSDLPSIVVANKCDLEGSPAGLKYLETICPDFISVSATEKKGLDQLINMISHDMTNDWEEYELFIPYKNGDLISKIKTLTQVLKEEAKDNGMAFKIETSSTHYINLNLAEFDMNPKEKEPLY